MRRKEYSGIMKAIGSREFARNCSRECFSFLRGSTGEEGSPKLIPHYFATPGDD